MSADMANDKDKKTTAAQAKPAAKPQARASSPASAKPEPTPFSRRRVWPD